MSETDIALELPAMRVSYEQSALDESQLAAAWQTQLQHWLDEARNAGLAGAQRDGARDSGPRRPAVIADGAVQGH